MKTLPFLSSVKHFIESIKNIDIVDNNLFVTSDLFNEPVEFRVPLVTLTEKQQKAFDYSYEYLGVTKSEVDSNYLMSIESWVMSHRYIHGEILEVKGNKAHLSYYAYRTKITSCYEYFTNMHIQLEVFFLIRSGYTISEIKGEGDYTVTTPSGNVRYITGNQCDCKEFTLVNRGWKPCTHLKFKNAYNSNRSNFYNAGISSLV